MHYTCAKGELDCTFNACLTDREATRGRAAARSWKEVDVLEASAAMLPICVLKTGVEDRAAAPVRLPYVVFNSL